jgi:hypothetical protein
MSNTAIEPASGSGLERTDLYSPFDPVECARRISDAADVRTAVFSLTGRGGSRPVTGIVNGLSIRLRKRIQYTNSFQTLLTATLEPSGNGTRISCAFAMHRFTRWFMRIWMIGAASLGSIIFIVSAGILMSGSSAARGDAWLGLVVPLVLPVFGYALFKTGAYLARDEARFLADFLKQTLNAKEKPA